MAAAGFTVSATFKAIDRMSRPFRKMGGQMSKFAAKTEIGLARVNRGLRRLTPSFGKLKGVIGSFGLFIGGAALVGALGGAIGVFMDFEQANANLAAVLGTTSSKTIALQTDAKKLGATTAFTASQVAGLQTEYAKLGFSQKEILKVTKSTLDLAAATNTELPQAAKQVGAAIRAFGLDAAEGGRVADVFALATSKSALNMEFLDTAMSKVAPVAKQFGFSIEDSTALLGKLADAGFDSSTAATSTRSILLNLADANGKLAKKLGGPVKTLPELTAAMVKLKAKGIDLNTMLGITDKRSVAAFATFLEGAEGVNKLAGELNNAGGAAKAMADKQLDTLTGSVTIMKSAYEGFILSLEDGTGAFSKTLRTIVDVTTEVLSLASGTATAESKLTENQKTIRSLANTTIKWLKVIGWVVAAIVGLKLVIGAVGLALKIYTGITKTITSITWAWNTAAAILNGTLILNPIGLIIVGIIALIAIIALIINKYDDWGAAVTLLLGPFGLLINIVQSFRRHWDSIVDAFKNGGIVAGLKRIGLVLLDAILMPVQQLLELLAKIPGMAGLATSGADKIKGIRESLELTTPEEVEKTAPEVNQQAAAVEAQVSREEKSTNSTLDVNIKNGAPDQVDVQSSGIVPNVLPTFSF